MTITITILIDHYHIDHPDLDHILVDDDEIVDESYTLRAAVDHNYRLHQMIGRMDMEESVLVRDYILLLLQNLYYILENHHCYYMNGLDYFHTKAVGMKKYYILGSDRMLVDLMNFDMIEIEIDHMKMKSQGFHSVPSILHNSLPAQYRYMFLKNQCGNIHNQSKTFCMH